MQIDYETALRFYTSLPSSLQSPSHHPEYVVCDALRTPASKPVFWMYQEDGACYYHAFLTTAIPHCGAYDIQSAYGYGGPIATTSDEEFLNRAWQSYLKWCHEHHIMVEFIRFHPLLNNLIYYGGKTEYNRQTVWVDLSEFNGLDTYPGRTRTAVRKAQKHGLHVEWWQADRFLPEFTRLYRHTMQRLGASNFYFFPNVYFEQLLNWDAAHLGVVLDKEQVVAAAVFLITGEYMEYHLSASTDQGRRLGAANLLLHGAFHYAQRAGCKRAHLGGGRSTAPDDPLLFFKSSFSPLRADFHIGHYIHDPETYAQLKSRHPNLHSEKIIFYR